MHRQANGEFTVSFWSWTPSGTLTKQQMKVTFKSTRVSCDFVPPSPQRPNSSG